jgi:hypothetical protein
MKRMVMIAMGLLLLAGSAFAQLAMPADTTYPGLPDTAYVGLFADAGHTVRSVNYGGAPAAFQWYIFFLPPKMGFQGAEFMIQLPANVVSITVLEKDPAITVELGSLLAGISTVIAEGTCRSDWFYLYKLQSILFSNVQSQIEVVANPAAGAYQIVTCELGYPIAPLKRFTHLYLNWDGGIAVKETNWGAIKELFK